MNGRQLATHAAAGFAGLLVGAVLGFFGVLTLLGGAWAPSPEPPALALAGAESRDTQGLAAKLTPPVQKFLGDNRDAFASRAGGPIERLAIRWGVPIAQRETPVVLENGLDTLATELSGWSVSDIVRWLSSVAAKKGLEPPRAAREKQAENAP